MSLHDRVELDDCVYLPEFPADADPSEVRWTTKTFRPPAMTVYRITADGKLYEERGEYSVVPEEDRPQYDEERGGFENEWERAFGMLNKDREGWEQVEYHGMLEFSATVDDTHYRYEAKFTDGELETITRLNTDA